MRIVKLSKDDAELSSQSKLEYYFSKALHAKTPPGRFEVTPAKAKMKGVENGTLFLFSYMNQIQYLARSSGTIVQEKNASPYIPLKIDSIKKLPTPILLKDFESHLRSKGHIEKSLTNQAWTIIPDSIESVVLDFLFENEEHNELNKIEQDLEDESLFRPTSITDAREICLRSIVQRRGQSEFRNKLLHAYDRKCSISDTDCEQTLEAAHIIPYSEEGSNHISNGILLRSDLHTLFDLDLLKITENHTVIVDQSIESEEYRTFNGKKVRLPKHETDHPSIEAIKIRNNL